MDLKARFVPAIIEWEPYEDPTDPDFPSFAPASMVGNCPTHGFQRVVSEGVTPGPDPSAFYRFQCGDIDVERF
jgi:hypothetical protein